MGIFSQTAPGYWAKGLPAIPLQPKTKIPVSNGWNKYAHQMIEEDIQGLWLEKYADGNIGLPMGEQSGLVAVDVDTDDIAVQDILKRVLPVTPWVRRGKKGAVYLYRWKGHKTFRIRTQQGASLLEVLSSGTQIVLPPSIHPDTQMPYVANSNLVDVLDHIPHVPLDIETTLRKALIEAGYDLSTRGYTKVTEVISVGSRDSKMTSVAGIMARGVLRGERTILEAISEMVAWVENFTENVAGDRMDPQKAVSKLMEFIGKDLQLGNRQLPATWSIGMSEEERKKFELVFGQDSQSWPLDEMLNYLTEQFEKFSNAEGIIERNRAIDLVVKKLARDDQVTSMEEDIVFQFITQSCGRMITKGALRKRLLELRKGEIPGDTHSEAAQLVVNELERYGEVRCHNSKFWQWKGSHWEPLEKNHLMAMMARDFGNLPATKRQSDHEGIYRMLMAMMQKALSNSSVRGLNFANGFLTTDLRLLPHDMDHGCTYVLPYSYEESRAGHCQKFLSFLYQSWGHCPDYLEKVQALREALAVTLFGLAPSFQKSFCLIGVPHSGKSVMMGILQSMMPEDAISYIPPSKWNDKFMPTLMDGKLLNACGELSESDMISGDLFKSIVDGESMAGQFKGQQIFTFRPTCAHWFASNHLPRTRDSSAGFTRRWLFFHFDKAVPADQRIVGLANDIAAEEQEAIVAWAAQVIPDVLRRSSIVEPSSHRGLVGQLAGMNNSVRYFLAAGGLRYGPKEVIEESLFHAAYTMFCRERGTRPVSGSVFKQRLAELQTEFSIQMMADGGDDKIQGVALAHGL